MFLDKYKTFYLSCNIKLQVFHVSMEGVYVKIFNVTTKRGISLFRYDLSKLIRRIRVFNRINDHSLKWRRFFNGEFVLKRIHFTNKTVIFNKYFDHIVLDELSIKSLLNNENQLVQYFDKIQLCYEYPD